jgi:hypothetical protein
MTSNEEKLLGEILLELKSMNENLNREMREIKVRLNEFLTK